MDALGRRAVLTVCPTDDTKNRCAHTTDKPARLTSKEPFRTPATQLISRFRYYSGSLFFATTVSNAAVRCWTVCSAR